MRAKNIIIILIAFLGIIACRDEITPQYPKGPGMSGNVKDVPLDDEAIYRIQTDKNSMINNLIRYNYTEKKYLLDISEQDALSIGITTEMYENTKKLVEKMNELNLEHLEHL